MADDDDGQGLQLSGVGLATGDLAAMQRFYVGGLGCRVVFEGSDIDAAITSRLGVTPGGLVMTMLRTAHGEAIKLVQATDRPALGPVGRTTITAPAGLAYLTFVVDDVAAAKERALAHGGTLLSDPDFASMGFVADPDGNLVELLLPRP